MGEKRLSNCLSCAIGLSVAFSSIFGLPCMSVACLHKGRVNKIKIAYSRTRFYSASMIAVFLITVSAHYALLIITAAGSIEKNNVLKMIIFLSNFLFCIRSSFAIVICTCKSNIMVSVYNKLEDIRKNWKFVQKEDLLDIEDVKRLRGQSIFFLALLISTSLFYGSYLMSSNCETLWKMSQKFATILCFCIDSELAITYSTVAKLYRSLFSTYQKNLKSLLIRYKSLFEHNRFRKIGIEARNNSVRKSLIQNRQLHCSLICNMAEYNTFCDPGTVIWLIIALLLLVSNSFVFLVLWIDKSFDFLDSGFMGMELQLYLVCLTITYSLYNLHQLKTVNEDILSFLFQYPFSKLSLPEANEVEMLIKALGTQKPILKGSDIFNVDITLLASISGFVLTYVLVAFQFHSKLPT